MCVCSFLLSSSPWPFKFSMTLESPPDLLLHFEIIQKRKFPLLLVMLFAIVIDLTLGNFFPSFCLVSPLLGLIPLLLHFFLQYHIAGFYLIFSALSSAHLSLVLLLIKQFFPAESLCRRIAVCQVCDSDLSCCQVNLV